MKKIEEVNSGAEKETLVDDLSAEIGEGEDETTHDGSSKGADSGNGQEGGNNQAKTRSRNAQSDETTAAKKFSLDNDSEEEVKTIDLEE